MREGRRARRTVVDTNLIATVRRCRLQGSGSVVAVGETMLYRAGLEFEDVGTDDAERLQTLCGGRGPRRVDAPSTGGAVRVHVDDTRLRKLG